MRVAALLVVLCGFALIAGLTLGASFSVWLLVGGAIVLPAGGLATGGSRFTQRPNVRMAALYRGAPVSAIATTAGALAIAIAIAVDAL